MKATIYFFVHVGLKINSGTDMPIEVGDYLTNVSFFTAERKLMPEIDLICSKKDFVYYKPLQHMVRLVDAL